MSEQKKHYRIFISSAEPSADTHCANLIKSLKDSNESFSFYGVGGSKMAQADCELLDNTVDKAAMIYNALANITYFRRLIKKIKKFFADNEIDLVIVCDSPAFNFHVAKAAKQAGIKTLFYVAPQLWAWGGWRIKKLKKSCDKLCCILPFEQQWFQAKGMDAVFVGNPLLDDCQINHQERTANKEPQDIALMPGSREAEINSLWKPMQQIAIELKNRYPNLNFTVVALNEKQRKNMQEAQIPDFGCKYVIDSVKKTAQDADFTIVASGSATLEVAAAGCPMVIMYQSSKILWHLLGRWLIKTQYLSLVNIIAGEELVPEFMPYFDSIEPITAKIDSLLKDSEKLAQTSSSLNKLVEPLAKKHTNNEVAKIVIDMLG